MGPCKFCVYLMPKWSSAAPASLRDIGLCILTQQHYPPLRLRQHHQLRQLQLKLPHRSLHQQRLQPLLQQRERTPAGSQMSKGTWSNSQVWLSFSTGIPGWAACTSPIDICRIILPQTLMCHHHAAPSNKHAHETLSRLWTGRCLACFEPVCEVLTSL